jgi:hypothetical protein
MPPSGACFAVVASVAEQQCTDANAEHHRFCDNEFSSVVVQRSGSRIIVQSAEFGAPAWMKLLITSPLEL